MGSAYALPRLRTDQRIAPNERCRGEKMPLYEFYCEPCHALFTFRFSRVDTTSVPECPVCGKPLQRQISPFACIIKGAVKSPDEKTMDTDEARYANREELIAQMTNRLNDLSGDDADPAEAVRVMREMATAGGLHFQPEIQEAMARIEAGEDPEKIDEQFGELFNSHDPFQQDNEGKETPTKQNADWLRRLKPPRRDPTWYDFPRKEP